MTLSTAIPTDPAFAPPDHWRALQATHLTHHLKQAAKSRLYKTGDGIAGLAFATKITAANLDETLRQLPTTTKDQLAAAGPTAFAAPPEDFREWVSTSGTLGKPLDIPLTAADLDRLAENEAAALSLAGLGRGDLFIMAVAMDRMFVAGLAYWLGAQKIGATCLRAGPHFDPQLLTRFPHARTLIITVPSVLAQSPAMSSPGRPPAAIIAIGEPIRNPDLTYNTLAQLLHNRFHCPILSTYANTETCTSFAEGPQCLGGHLNPNLALLEILDDANHPVPPNTPGEVTITPLCTHALPLLRFKTGDIATLHTDPCPCGRTTPRLGPILGRRQQLLKIRGTSLFPNAILETLRTIPEVHDSLLIADHDPLHSDRLTLHLHLPTDTPALRTAIESRLRTLLRVLPEIRYTDPAALQTLRPPNARKPNPFIDRR